MAVKTQELFSKLITFLKPEFSFLFFVLSKLFLVLSDSENQPLKAGRQGACFLDRIIVSECGGRSQKDEAVLTNATVLKGEEGKLPAKSIETIKRLIFHCCCKLPFCLLSFQHFISHQLRQLGKTALHTNRCRLT